MVSLRIILNLQTVRYFTKDKKILSEINRKYKSKKMPFSYQLNGIFLRDLLLSSDTHSHHSRAGGNPARPLRTASRLPCYAREWLRISAYARMTKILVA